MKNYLAKLTPIVVPAIKTAALLLVFAAPILAQTNPTFPKPATKENPRTDPGEFRGRNDNITLLERGKDEAQKRQLVMQQMNEDFEKIQSSDRDVLSAASVTEAPDYNRIVEGLVDISKRASRLQKNMALPSGKTEKEKNKSSQTEVGELRPALISLNDLITSFVSSPIFRRDTTVDDLDLSKARRDLASIVDLSEKIRRSVEKNAKPAIKQ